MAGFPRLDFLPTISRFDSRPYRLTIARFSFSALSLARAAILDDRVLRGRTCRANPWRQNLGGTCAPCHCLLTVLKVICA